MSKKVKKTLKATFPRVAPHVTVGDYLESKETLDHVQLPGRDWDKPSTRPEVYLTAAKRVLIKTEAALELRRDFLKSERVILADQWEDLEEKERILRGSFTNLSDFVKSNHEKRTRAAERLQEHGKLLEERRRSIEDLKQKMAVLEEMKKDLDGHIGAHLIYNHYLDTVCFDEFKNPEDILSRYESLVITRNELGQRQSDMFRKLETARNRIAKMADENKFILLGMNNVISSLNARYQIAATHAMHWERIVTNIKSKALERCAEIYEVKQASWNIYSLMCRRKNETRKLLEGDFEKQMIYIKKTLREIALAKEEAMGLTKKSFSSMKVETSKVS